MSQAGANSTPDNEPELRLLLDGTFEPLWKSLFRGFNDVLFPKKLSPLALESKPIPVRDIWGSYDYKKNGAMASIVAHVVVVGAIIAVTLIPMHGPVPNAPKPWIETKVIDPDIYLPNPARERAGGGGGGGDRDVLPASMGRLPRISMRQITPPAAVIRNPDPKLAVEPTVIAPPEIKVAMDPTMPNLGDPKSSAIVPSNGPGARGGIGVGDDGGVGPGHGRGVGPGDEAGRGGDTFHVGGGVTAPRVIYETEPEFSEEARRAKYQGNCILGLVVDAKGHPTNIRILNSLGMGLDEKAIESVRNWKFEPGKKNGQGVAVEIAIEVDFHLY
jgi:periplasmic protein TonB